MSFHSKFQSGGVLSLVAMHCAVQGLTGALPGNATLAPTGAAIATTTLGDGRTAWRLPAGGTSQLTSGAQTIPNFYGGAAMCRFVWQGYNAGQNDCRLLVIGNLLYIGVTGGRLSLTSINGQVINAISVGPTLTTGSEYVVVWNVDYSTLTATAYLNGTSIFTTALAGWTPNTTMSTQVTMGDATGRGAADIIEFGWYNGSQTASALTNTQVATVSGASYFLDILRPTHPATAPMTYTASIIGGRATDVHTVGLRRTSDPINDAGSIVATGNRTGPGAISIADPATDTSGRRFYRLEVSSTGGVTMTSTNYGSGAPGGFVLGCVPVPTAPTAAAFSTVAGCPKIGIITDSRGTPQTNNNIPYRIMRGGTTDNCIGIVAPGAGWAEYNGTNYSGTLYTAAGGTTNLSNTNLMTAYLAAAATEGVTVTGVMLDVNNWGSPATDTTWRTNLSGVIASLRNANHKVVLLRDIGNEFSAQSQSNFIAHEAYIASICDGVNVVYSDDLFQRWYAAFLDMVSLDGTHLYGTGALNGGGAAIGGQTAAQITANYMFAAIQSAILPGVLLSINNAVGTVEPGNSLQRTLTLRPTNGFTGNCALNVAGLPTGVTVTFSPTSPLTITGSGAVTVTMTLTAASDAPLAGSTNVVVTASAATSAPTVALALSVVDVTPPHITGVVIDTNGQAVTITMDSPVTGNSGISLFENGSFRVLGTLTNLDGYHLTGTLTSAVSAGSSVTWQYNPATGNMVDVGGNEVPASSGSVTNNTGGGSGVDATGLVLLGRAPYQLTLFDTGTDGNVSAFVDDAWQLLCQLTNAEGQPIPVASSQLTALLSNLAGETVSSPTVQVVCGDLGIIRVQATLPSTPGRVRLTVLRHVSNSNSVRFGPILIDVARP